MKKTSPEVESKVIELYLNGEKLKDIEKITGSKSIKHILKRNNIQRKRQPKEYNTTKKDERNKELIQEYLNGELSILELSKKYKVTDVNIYRVIKSYKIEERRKLNQHWVIHKKLKENPNLNCKFYILENYYGYTKIGITTKDKVKERFGKNVNVYYEINETLEYCYNLEKNLKRKFKSHIPLDINKCIDGWSECYNLSPEIIFNCIMLGN